MSEQVGSCLRVSESIRLYEEDPYTGLWTTAAPTRVVAHRSRFEVDLNRPREKAIYLTPDDAWGLDVWRCTPPQDLVSAALRAYDDFYAHLKQLLSQLVEKHGRVVVFDLHSYNHIRGGAGGAPAGADENPEINLGAGTMDRAYWGRIVERWLAETRSSDYFGRGLDVRENVKFYGGQVPRWIHENFPGTVCALAVEVKKIFMDEWTGELDASRHKAIGAVLTQAANGVLQELERWET